MSAKLAKAFEAFAGGAGMDGPAFARCVRDAGLLKRGLKAEEADLVFVTCRPRGARKIDMAHFRRALALVAAKRGVKESLIEERVCAARGPAYLAGSGSGNRSRSADYESGNRSQSATRPHHASPTRLFYDKSTYTGTHRHGGPDALGSGIPFLGYRDLSELVNRDRVQSGVLLPKSTGHEREDTAEEAAALPLDGRAHRLPVVTVPAEQQQDPRGTDTEAPSALLVVPALAKPSKLAAVDPAVLASPPQEASSTEMLPGSGLLVPCTVTHLQHRPMPLAPATVVWPGCAIHAQNGTPSGTLAYAAVLPPAVLMSPRPAMVRDAALQRRQYTRQHSVSKVSCESMTTVPVLAAASPSPPLSPRRASPRRLSSPFPRAVAGQHAVPLLSGPLSPAVAAMKVQQVSAQHAVVTQQATSSPSHEGAAVQAGGVPIAGTAATPAAATPVAAQPTAVAEQAVAQSTQKNTTTPIPTGPSPVNSQATLAKSAGSQPSSVVLQALASQPTSAVQSASIAPNSCATPASPAPSQNTVTQGAAAQASAAQQTTASPQVSSLQATTSQPVATTHQSSGSTAPPPSPSSEREAANSLAAPPASPQQDTVTQQAMSAQQAAVAQQAAAVHQTVATQQASAAQQAPTAHHASTATGPPPQATQVYKIQKTVSFAQR